jgi:hypothetical protein
MKPPGLSPVIYSTPSIPGRDSSNKVLYSSKEKCPWFFMGIRTYIGVLPISFTPVHQIVHQFCKRYADL